MSCLSSSRTGQPVPERGSRFLNQATSCPVPEPDKVLNWDTTYVYKHVCKRYALVSSVVFSLPPLSFFFPKPSVRTLLEVRILTPFCCLPFTLCWFGFLLARVAFLRIYDRILMFSNSVLIIIGYLFCKLSYLVNAYYMYIHVYKRFAFDSFVVSK